MRQTICLFLCLLSFACAAVIGLDFGSKWGIISVWRHGKFGVIEDEYGARKQHAIVAFDEQGYELVGDAAIKMLAKDPTRVAQFSTQLLGKKYGHPFIEENKKHFVYNLTNNSVRGTYDVSFGNQTFSSEEIVAMMLRHFKRVAEKRSNITLVDVIITVDPFTTHQERQAMIDAANIAGLNTLSLINGPTSFALTYAMERPINQTIHSVFVDIGATSLKTSLIVYSTSKDTKSTNSNATIRDIQVIESEWDSSLGGREFDNRMADLLAEKVAIEAPHVDCKTPRNRQTLLREAVRVKEVLSVNKDCVVKMEYGSTEPELHTIITRTEFESRCEDLFARVLPPIKKALTRANWTTSTVDFVEIVGGTTRIPRIQQLILDHFGISSLSRHVSADESSSTGALYWWGVRQNAPARVRDTAVYSSRMSSTLDKPFSLFRSDSKLGAKKGFTFTTEEKSFNISIEYEDTLSVNNTHVLPAEFCKTIGHYEITGMPSFEEHNYTSTPKAILSFSLGSNGLISLSKAEAEIEVIRMVTKKVKVEKPVTEKKDANKDEKDANKDEEKKEENKEEKKNENKGENEGKMNEAEENKKNEDEKEKKEEENTKEEKKEEENTKEEKKEEENTKEEKKEVKEEKKEEDEYIEETTPVRKIKRLKLNVKHTTPCFSHLTKEEIERSSKRLDELDAKNDIRVKTGSALNELESYMYKIKNKILSPDEEIEMENLSDFATEEEHKKLGLLVEEINDWLEDEGYSSTLKEYEARMDSLSAVASKVFFRAKERKQLPIACGQLLSVLNATSQMLHPEIVIAYNVTGEIIEKLLNETRVDEDYLASILEQSGTVKNSDDYSVTSSEVKDRTKKAEARFQKVRHLPLKKEIIEAMKKEETKNNSTDEKEDGEKRDEKTDQDEDINEENEKNEKEADKNVERKEKEADKKVENEEKEKEKEKETEEKEEMEEKEVKKEL